MSERFQPGDMVECVDATYPTERTVLDPTPLIHLGVYTVEWFGDITHHRTGVTAPSVRLVENPLASLKWGWAARRFRLLYRPSADLITRLTAAPALLPPERVKEAA